MRDEARESGAGRALMKAVARVAVENDCVVVTWELWNENALARDVYEKFGCWVAEDVNPMRLDASAIEAMAREQAMSRYRELAGTGRTSNDVRQVLSAAVYGKVERLLVDRCAHRWGTFDAETYSPASL